MKNKMIFYVVLLVSSCMVFGMEHVQGGNQLKLMIKEQDSCVPYSATFQRVFEMRTKESYQGCISTYDGLRLSVCVDKKYYIWRFGLDRSFADEEVLQQFLAQYDNKEYGSNEKDIILLLQEENVENGKWFSVALNHDNVKRIKQEADKIFSQKTQHNTTSITGLRMDYNRLFLFVGVLGCAAAAWYFDILSQFRQLMVSGR